MIRYGIIGAGRMGNNHAGQIKLLDNATVAAVYDIRPEASAAFREKFGARVCRSATELEGKAVPLPTVRDAWNSLAVSFAMIESTKTGKAVVLK